MKLHPSNRFALVVSTLIVILWTQERVTGEKIELFSYGPNKDQTLRHDEEDSSSPEIPLTVPIVFYGRQYKSIFVNENGILSFRGELPSYFSAPFPLPQPVIAPLYADADNRINGNVFYRETQDTQVLNRFDELIGKYFSSTAPFHSHSVFLATWDKTRGYASQNEKENTYQVIIGTDGVDSYVLFLYPSGAVQWLKGEGKNKQVGDAWAQSGFSSGDGTNRLFMLKGSGTEQLLNLDRMSNAGQHGVFAFKVSREIEEPDKTEPQPENETCSNTFNPCPKSSECIDSESGICCACSAGFLGNGRYCVMEESQQRISGKVNGLINEFLFEQVEIHAFVMTADGRSYVAMSRVPDNAGAHLQTLFPISSLVGWLFAPSASPGLKNGFQLTGAIVNRSIDIAFPAQGNLVTITEKLEGLDVFGNMKMSVDVRGHMPQLPTNPNGAQLFIPDYSIEFTRVSSGVLRSHAMIPFQVEGLGEMMAVVDQTINYVERPCDEAIIKSGVRLKVSRSFIMYDEKDRIVRYAQRNKLTALADNIDENACKDVRCTPHSHCVLVGNGAYQCICDHGFRPIGERDRMPQCTDLDECTTGRSNCHAAFGECLNTEGGFRCRCKAGYRGDGVTCEPERSAGTPPDGDMDLSRTCNVLQNCDPNAKCLSDDYGRYYCACNAGLVGDGYRCSEPPTSNEGDQEDDGCGNACSSQARCIQESEHVFTCRCNPGYIGNGLNCTLREVSLDECAMAADCGENAQCVPDYERRRRVCKCVQGFTGNGRQCKQQTVEPDAMCERPCGPRSRCVMDPYRKAYTCQCEPGTYGDGYRCEVQTCQMNPAMCHADAECVPPYYTCRCKPGFNGDGRQCIPAPVVDHRDEYLLFGQGMSILQMPLPSSRDKLPGRLLIMGEQHQAVVGLAVDCKGRQIYWTDAASGTIRTANLNGSNPRIFQRALHTPEGIAVDWVSRNIFWTDSGSDTIEVMGMNPMYPQNNETTPQYIHRVVISTNLFNPRGIAVHPTLGKMYWSDWDRQKPRIEVANMDGSDRSILVSEDLHLPNMISVDQEANYLCWTDSGMRTIECVNLNGQGRRVIHRGAEYPFGLTMSQGNIYWTDWNIQFIHRINRNGGSAEPLNPPLGGNGKLYSITTVPPSCPSGHNVCGNQNGGCPPTHLCVPRGDWARSCLCPSNNATDCKDIA